MKASLQLSQVLDRLEEDEERQQETLQRRIEAEREELKVTMSFSRAAAVAAVEQEVTHTAMGVQPNFLRLFL